MFLPVWLALVAGPSSADASPGDGARVWLSVVSEIGTEADALLVKRARKAGAEELREVGIEVDIDAPRRIHLTIAWAAGSAETHELRYVLAGNAMEEPRALRSSQCLRCGSDEIVAMVRDDFAEIAGALERSDLRPVEPAPAAVAPSPVVTPDAAPTAPRRARLGKLGKAGIGMAAVGLAAAVTGVGLLAAGSRTQQGQDELEVKHVEYRAPGAVLLAGGGAALVAGIAMLVVDRRRAHSRRNHVSAWIGPRSAGVSIAMRW